MKKIFAILLGVATITLVAANYRNTDSGGKDFTAYRFADGACYSSPPNSNLKLPAIYDGYWGAVDVRFDTDTSSRIIHINFKDETRSIILANSPLDRQSQQNILIKRKDGVLKAYILSAATEEQFKKALFERKVYYYGGYKQIQDGEKNCSSCKGIGKTSYGGNSNRCSSCKGTGKTPNILNLPEIKILE